MDSKLAAGRIKNDVMSRITVAMPKPRDNNKRGAFIPESVVDKSSQMNVGDGSERMTEKKLMWNNGGPGVYVCDYRKYYLLENDEWKFDTVPEFMDGKNIIDFFDPDIEDRLNNLDREEAELEANNAYSMDDEEDEDDIDEEDMLIYEAIKEKQTIARKASHVVKPNIPTVLRVRGRSEADIKSQLESVGLESAGVIEHTRGRKRARSREPAPVEMDTETTRAPSSSRARSTVSSAAEKKRIRSQSAGRDISATARSQSATRGPSGSVAPHQVKQVSKNKKTLERHLSKFAKGGPGDREHYPKLIKHLNSGKRSLGTSTIGR